MPNYFKPRVNRDERKVNPSPSKLCEATNINELMNMTTSPRKSTGHPHSYLKEASDMN